ncbi:hypothetical protein GCM10027346_08320 [Hymenobacter seoulensis]
MGLALVSLSTPIITHAMHSTPPDSNPTQLIRYRLQISPLSSQENIGQARQVLTGLGLVVDLLEAGEAEVAVATTDPGKEAIVKALTAAGFTVADITAESS